MNYCKITAIIQPSRLEAVEQKLKQLCVPGVSITKVQGYGEAHNFFQSDWTSAYARVEVFTEVNGAQEIADGIMDAAHTGKEGDGMVAILPVKVLYHIRTKKEHKSAE